MILAARMTPKQSHTERFTEAARRTLRPLEDYNDDTVDGTKAQSLHTENHNVSW
jgi:hypothetical protein